MSDPFGAELPLLVSPRLRLRHPRPSDVDDVLAIFSDPAAMRYWSHEPMVDRAEAEAYLAAIDSGFAERSLFQWAIALPQSEGARADRLVGTVTLYEWSRKNRRAALGYMLSPAHQGRGLATEAVRTVLQFAFGPMDLHRVEADVHPDNARSVRLLERLGFVCEGRLAERWFTYGEWSDSALYGLLRKQFA